jgi:uncharacterized membrane protein
MADDKLIKSGQFTFARLLFLVACGAIIFGIVALGGKFLSFGYLILTAVICVLLYLVAIDYGVNMDKVDTTPTAAATLEPALATGTVTEEARAKRKSAKAAKRRR